MENTFNVQEITGVSKTDYEYVKDADVDGKDYVDGSQGSIKKILEYNKNSSLMRTTTFYYRDSELPENVTETIPINS